MNLYISAERNNTYFVDTINEYCTNSQGKHTAIFLPDIPATPGETLSRRIIRHLNSSDLIFMDLTPQEYKIEINANTFETRYFTNTGIVIEYSIAIILGRIEDMKIYCLISPDNLHQVWRERIVDPYPQGDKPAFLSYIDAIVTTRENDSLQVLRQSRVQASFRSLYPEI